MKELMAIALGAAAVANVHAATPKEAAAQTILKALRCELPPNQTANVLKAVKTLGGKVSKTVGNEFALPVPLELYGMQIALLAINDDEEQSYIATAKGVAAADVAAAAKAPKGGFGFQREMKHGTVNIDSGEEGTRLFCSVKG